MILDSLAILIHGIFFVGTAIFFMWCFYSYKEFRLACLIFTVTVLPLIWAGLRLQ